MPKTDKGVNDEQRAWPVYRRLIGYASPYRAAFILAIVAMAIDAAMDAGLAMLMNPLIEDGFVERDESVVRYIPLLLLAIFATRGIASFIYTYLLAWVGRKVIIELRRQVFDRYLVLPAIAYDHASSGGLLSKLTYDIEQVAQAASNALVYLVRDSLKIVFLLGVMIYHSWQLSLVILVVGPSIGALIHYVSKLFRRHSRSIQDSMGEVTQVAEEAIEGNRVVKVFGGRAYESERFEAVNESNRRSNMRLETARAGSQAVSQWIAGAGMAAIIYFATTQIEPSPGDFTAFLGAMLLLMAPLKHLTNINAPLQKGIAAARSVFAVLDREPEDAGGSYDPGRARGDIRFRGVSFSYDEEKGRALSEIDLHVAPGRRVALVGRSGSGKSTLVSLIPRLYDAQEGSIELDGRDLREYDLAALRRQVAVVSQEVVLFNDTIAGNVAYGELSGRPRSAIEEATRLARVDEFAERLPHGLDTVIGDRGVLLSGGQRQRIAIARALLKDAPVLILDEATSALDSESERAIQSALDRLMEDRTTLVIAHRLSTVENADSVLVLREGRLVEQGSHGELLSLGGEYAALHRLQFRDDAKDS